MKKKYVNVLITAADAGPPYISGLGRGSRKSCLKCCML
jgi:hypothetical protein